MAEGDAQVGSAGLEGLLEQADWVRRLAGRLVGDPEAAEDLTQDVWLAALRRGPSEGGSRNWVRRVLRNALSARRRAGAYRDHAPLEDGESTSEAPTPARLVERAELHEHLVRAVVELREPFRTVLLLRYFEGRSPNEIANLLGVPGATVRSRLKRGIAELRRQLDERHPEDFAAWSAVLLPVFERPPWVGASLLGAATMKSSTQISVAAAVSVACLFAAWKWTSRDPVEPAARISPAGEAALVRPAEPQTVAAAAERNEAEREPLGVSAPEELVLTLVDEATGEPVPHYEFQLRIKREHTTHTTDALGRASLPQPVGIRRAQWVGIDDRRIPRFVGVDLESRSFEGLVERELTLRSGDDEIELSIPVGPTYTLDMALPDGVEPGTLDAIVSGGVEPLWRDYLRQTWGATVRDGESLWLRFPPLNSGMLPPEGPWELDLTSRDGYWRGTAELRHIAGIVEPPIAVELAACGRLVCRVANDAGQLGQGVSATFRSSPTAGAGDAQHEDEPYYRQSSPDDEGRIVLQWLQPGRYDVSLYSVRDEWFEDTLEVEPLRTTERAIRLASRPAVGSIEGALTSQSGNFRAPLFVTLMAQPNGMAQQRLQPSWVLEGDVYKARFAFHDLPEGGYTVVVQAFGTQVRWDRESVVAHPPARDVEFLCLDEEERIHFGWRFHDAETGAPIENFEIVHYAGGSQYRGRNSALLRDMPRGAQVQWKVIAPGYASEFGDESVFELDDFVDGEPARMADIALRPGWAVHLRVIDGATGDRLEGVAVRLDGVEVAVTDARGLVEVYAPEEPARIELERAGWRQQGVLEPSAATASSLSWIPAAMVAE